MSLPVAVRRDQTDVADVFEAPVVFDVSGLFTLLAVDAGLGAMRDAVRRPRLVHGCSNAILDLSRSVALSLEFLASAATIRALAVVRALMVRA